MAKLHHREREHMSAFQPRVEPSVLNWARDSAMLSLSEAARLIGVPDSTVEEWEAGTTKPSMGQLRQAAAVYRQSIAAFLLDAPPPENPALVAFRTSPAPGSDAPSRSLTAGLQRSVNQQDIVRYIASLDDESLAPAELELRSSMDTERAGTAVRDWLGITMARQLAWGSNDEAFDQWVAAIEAKRMLVVQVPNVSLREMRAFAEQSRPFPVIGLNGKDAATERIFSLMHELIHVLLEAGSDSLLHIMRPETDGTGDAFCNRVAAAVLMPLDDLMRQDDVASASASSNWSDEQIRRLSTRYRVGSETVVLRLAWLRKANVAVSQWTRQRHDAEHRERAERTRASEAGTDAQARVRERGRLFVLLVLSAYNADRISSRDVTRYLGVQSDQLPELAKIVGLAG